MLRKLTAATAVTLGLFATAAMADTIDPTSFAADLAVGDSVTVRKTVVVEEGAPTDAKIDIHFLFDTSGSMGSEIAAAKAAAADIFTGLAAFGDVAASVGVYSEAARLTGATPGLVINQDLTTDVTTATNALNAVTLGVPDGGGDGPENGVNGIELSTENLSWRTGSSRFMFVFGDYGFKTSDCAETYTGAPFDDCDPFDDVDGAPISTFADAAAALAAEGVDLYGLQFSGSSSFTGSIELLGGTALASSADPDDIVDDILTGVSTGFSTYEEVTVDDLGGGLPEIAVSTVCVSADTGVCDGAIAKGTYDRSSDRTFEFDVTFTRMAAGDKAFPTFALVDGGIVATEKDRFGGDDMPPIPLPAAGWLMIAGLGGLMAAKRRKA